MEDWGEWDGRHRMKGAEWEVQDRGAGWERWDERCGMGCAVWEVQYGRCSMEGAGCEMQDGGAWDGRRRMEGAEWKVRKAGAGWKV